MCPSNFELWGHIVLYTVVSIDDKYNSYKKNWLLLSEEIIKSSQPSSKIRYWKDNVCN